MTGPFSFPGPRYRLRRRQVASHNQPMILHIVQKNAWRKAAGGNAYRAASLELEGFMHCSTVEQVLIPANERFQGQEGLVLLCIDPCRVTAPIVYEDCYASGRSFPHIYGPLNVDAVTAVVPFPPQADGRFLLPPELEPFV